MKSNRTIKLKVKSIKPHTNFAQEIYAKEKADKFLDRAFYITISIIALLGMILLIVNLTR